MVQGVGTLVDRRNKIAQAISKAAKDNFRMNIDDNKLRAADGSVLNQFAQRLNQFVKERSDLERALNEISSQVGGPKLDFSGNNFQDSVNKIRQAVDAMKGKLADADRAVATRNQEIQRQRNDITGKVSEIDSLKKQLEEKNYQLDSLRTALGLAGDAPLPMPWKPGSPEVRKRVVGRVSDVSDKYGYIAINLGTESTVDQQLGNKVGQINVALVPGLEMVVSRGELEVPTSDYITKVKLTKVEKDGSIAEPIGAAKGSVRVGDKVWFDIN
ncbi:hypothetical protein SDC9_165673 [bioreactor metagenome]|uniref:Uncharacterized protein n=1 Tax=bioreactor metagenome TaxID=1076179 RepID=A0A645G2I0_9ZZZZ